MSEGGVERGLTTILAADGVSYGRLMAADNTGTLTSLNAIRKELIQPQSAALSEQIRLSLAIPLRSFGRCKILSDISTLRLR